MAESFFRQLTRDEERDFQNLMAGSSKNVERKFKKMAVAVEQEHTAKHKPYCYRGALLDFRDEMGEIKDKIQRGIPTTKTTVELLESWEKKLQSYGDQKLFVLKGKNPVIEMKVYDGVKMPVETGISEEYYCEKYGTNHSVFVPKERIEKIVK